MAPPPVQIKSNYAIFEYFRIRFVIINFLRATALARTFLTHGHVNRGSVFVPNSVNYDNYNQPDSDTKTARVHKSPMEISALLLIDP